MFEMSYDFASHRIASHRIASHRIASHRRLSAPFFHVLKQNILSQDDRWILVLCLYPAVFCIVSFMPYIR